MQEELTTKQTDSFFTLAWGFAVIIIIIALIIGIAQIIASWKLYKKCRRKGWKSIIPFYASWIKIVEIAKLNWWWFLIVLLPSILLSNAKNMTVIISLVTLFVTFQCNYNIAKKFHKNTGFAILMTLLPTILYLILAFSKDYIYDDSAIYDYAKATISNEQLNIDKLPTPVTKKSNSDRNFLTTNYIKQNLDKFTTYKFTFKLIDGNYIYQKFEKM